MSTRGIEANKVTWVGLLLNFVLTVFKFTAGILGRSEAMIADAAHSLSDIGTDIVVLFSFKLADKPKDKTHDYGHGKIEALGSMIIGFALFFVGFKIVWFSVSEIVIHYKIGYIDAPKWIAFYAALVSIVFKEWLYRYTVKTGKRIDSQAVIANAWHHRSDSFSSIGAMLGIGGAILLGEKWRILDPIAAIIVSVFIIKIGVDIFYKSANELIDASLSDVQEEEILSVIRSVSGVKNPHNMKTRKVGARISIDVHIEVDGSCDVTQAHNVSTRVEEKLRQKYGRSTFISIHMEPFRPR